MTQSFIPTTFPRSFDWGVATSSFQIEGDRAGRGDTVWDVFCERPGAILDGSNGDVACDHLRLMADDVRLMVDLGVHSYRFSFAWARVLPDGTGSPSRPGLDQYSRLIDLLLDNGIEPVPTLFHWDLPQALEERGGFRSRECAGWFADYAATMVGEFGDRITRWATHNEPWCYSFLGHGSGVHAPGVTDPVAAVAVSHHLLLGHGLALQAMRAARTDLSLGIVLNPAPVHGDDKLGTDGVRRIDGTLNRWFLDPVITGRYPTDVLADMGEWAACVLEGDEAIIAQRLDWLGINYYNDHFDTCVADGEIEVPPAHAPSPHVTAPRSRTRVVDLPQTDIGWPITPHGFRDMLIGFRDTYRDQLPPIYITENGAAFSDPVVDGICDDQRRVGYLDSHVAAVEAAMDAGVDIRGYFAWSLLDNFEWAFGYAQRFGLVHVDYDTLVRTPKASARRFADIIRAARGG
jgi:beta-glucosidase